MRPGKKAVSRTRSAGCAASSRARPISLPSRPPASASSSPPTTTPRANALTSGPQPSPLPKCCTSSVNPPPGFRRDDKLRSGSYSLPGLPPLEISHPPLGGSLHAFLEVFRRAQLGLLDQFVIG